MVATADFWGYYGQATATLKIRQAATVTITVSPVTADGQPHPPTIAIDPPGALPALAVTYQAYDADPAHGGVLIGSPISQPPSDPGWYLVTATVQDGTYAGQATSLLVIAAPQGGGSGGGSGGGGGGGCGAGAAGLLLLAALGLSLRRSRA